VIFTNYKAQWQDMDNHHQQQP